MNKNSITIRRTVVQTTNYSKQDFLDTFAEGLSDGEKEKLWNQICKDDTSKNSTCLVDIDDTEPEDLSEDWLQGYIDVKYDVEEDEDDEDDDHDADKWFDRKYPNCSCHRCDKKLDSKSVVFCGGGGDCETWYCKTCHKKGTVDCPVCQEMNKE